MDKEKLVFEFIAAIRRVKDLDHCELVLLSVSPPVMKEFLKTAFKVERERRPPITGDEGGGTCIWIRGRFLKSC